MRRSIKCGQLRPRLLALKISIDTDTATSSVDIGGDDISSISYVSTGILDITFRAPFQTTVVGVANATTEDWRACVLSGANTTKTQARICITDDSGTAQDGDCYVFIVGRDSQFSDLYRRRSAELKGTRTNPRMLLFKADESVPSLTTGTHDGTIAKTGDGDYTITWDYNFSSPPIVVACATGTEASIAITAATISSATFKITDQGSTLTASDFYVAALGWQSSSEHGRRRLPIMSTQRNCEILPFQITYSAGTPSATIGTDLASSVDDDGTGDFGINFTNSFQRSDSVILADATEVAGSFAHAVGSATSAEINVVDNGGTAQDETVDVLVFGFDSPNQT